MIILLDSKYINNLFIVKLSYVVSYSDEIR